MTPQEIQVKIDERQAQLKDADRVEESELKREISMLESLKFWDDPVVEKELEYLSQHRELKTKQKELSAIGSYSERTLATKKLNKEQQDLFHRRFWGDLK